MAQTTSVRLTTYLRDQIHYNAMKDLFDVRQAEEDRVESDLAQRLMDWHIGAKNLALIKQLPAEYFFSKTDVRVRPAENSGSEYEVMHSIEGVKVPANLQYGSIVLPPTHGMWKEIRAVVAKKETLNTDKGAVRAQIESILLSATTIKRLLEIWPEVTPYLPAEDSPKSLPALRVDDLNAMIAKLKAKK